MAEPKKEQIRREKMRATMARLMNHKNRTLVIPFGDDPDLIEGAVSLKLDLDGMTRLLNLLDWDRPQPPIEFLSDAEGTLRARLLLTLKPELCRNQPENKGEAYII